VSEPVLVALIGLLGVVLVALIGLLTAVLVQAKATHKLINSRMTEMLELTRVAYRAEGVAAGEQAQRDRTAEPQA
jgi:hypothetical protein